MPTDPPRVERLRPYDDSADGSTPWRRSNRVRLFVATFVLVALAGVVWTLLQPVVYSSRATILMSSAAAVDGEVAQANIQNVAIQGRILLGREITARVAGKMLETHDAQINANDLATVLRVDGVPDTNLVELVAQGAESQWLPALVNTWIDEYIQLRAADIEENKRLSMQQVQGELAEVTEKIVLARDALEDYREEHDIISAQREENEVLARLDGLNEALNAALAEEVTTKAYLDTVRDSLARGERFVPPSQRVSLEALETELQALQAQMVEMTKRYTMDYINKLPDLSAVPQRIADLEVEIATELNRGQQLELEVAGQAHAAASRSVVELQRQLDAHKEAVGRFNRVYATHQALVDDLAALEELNRERQGRLVQMEVIRVEKYPQVTVIQRPLSRSQRIGPDYVLLLGATLGVAFISAVVVVWLYGFLGDSGGRPAYVTLSGVHMYPGETSGELEHVRPSKPTLDQARTVLLDEQPGVDETEAGNEPRQPG